MFRLLASSPESVSGVKETESLFAHGRAKSGAASPTLRGASSAKANEAASSTAGTANSRRFMEAPGGRWEERRETRGGSGGSGRTTVGPAGRGSKTRRLEV